MRRLIVITLASSIAIAGCNSAPPHRPEFSGSFPVEDCPEDLQGRIAVSAHVLDLPPSSQRSSDGVRTVGALGRRLLVSTTPAALDPGDRIVWSVLSLTTYGGTFVTWTRLQTDHATLNAIGENPVENLSAPRTRGDSQKSELATVNFVPGQIKVTRAAYDKRSLAGTMALDVLVMPGGVTVDNTIVHIPQLWVTPDEPLAPGKVQVAVSSIRHPPGLDTVEATAELNFVVRRSRTGDEWSCAAETRMVIVDEEAIRLPLWDLGLASRNAGRKSWLGLFTPSLGLVRVIFESSAEASSLANWLQTTGATTLGEYTLGLFEQPKRPRGPSFQPVDADALKTFRPLTAADIPAIRVGPVGEP